SGNTGTITLVGYNSTILNWESSIDNGVTWLPVVNTTPLQNYNNLTQTTDFRAIVTSGGCANDTSSVAIISVDSVSVGGAVTVDDTVCAGQNAGVLNLAGNTGTVTGWEMSTDGGTTWIALGNTSSSQGYNNLNVTTAFRTEVKNGVCPATSSAVATITVDQASNAGTISSNATVCQTYNGGTLVLNGVNGNVTDWQMSSDNGVTWVSLANVTNQQSYSALTDTTWYISIAVNGVCAADTSIPAVITVIPKPNASFTKNDTCFGLPIKFTNTTTVTGGYVQLYTWDFADNNNSTAGSPTHIYADTGTYMVSLVALSNFGCLDTFTLATTVKPVPSVAFTLSGPTTFCTGDSLVIMEPFDPNNTYSWSTGSTHDTLIVDTTGTWVLHVTNSVTGCSNADSVSTVLVPSLVADAGLSDTISIGNSITLNGSGGTNYSWSPAATLDIPTIANPVASPTTTTMYYLTVSSNNGCTSKDSVRITVEPKYDFEISTVITPNGDGYNDFWYIKNINFYPDNEVIIFNRYGQKVFSMTGYDNSWTGTSSSGNLPDGTYYYVLKFTTTDKTFNGGITVLRSK
ncbi:MAG: T9SS type B sorting domain-containing protein, partial [Bacteroidia bacterium]